MDSNPICQPSPAKKMKCSFLDFVQFLMISQAGQWTQTPSATPLQPKKWNAHFWIMFNFWWSAGWGTRTPSATPLQPKNWNAHFSITFNFWWLARLVNGPPIPPLSSQKHEMLNYVQLLMISRWSWTQTPSSTFSSQRNEMLIFVLCSTSRSAGLIDGLKPHAPPLSSQKNEMLIFVLHSTSDVGQTGRWPQTASTTRLQPIKWNPCFCITLNFWW